MGVSRILITPIQIVAVTVGFFFVQAEAGIRDWSVTGVQTCALPIYERVADEQRSVGTTKVQQSVEASSLNFCRADGTLLVGDSFIEAATLLRNVGPSSPGTTKQIGRASCSERVHQARS